MKSRPVVAIGLVALAVLCLLGGLGYAAMESSRQVTLPPPIGPHRVGRVLFDWTDASRVDPFAPGHAIRRELPVLVWYPADPAPGSTPTSYLPEGWTAALGGGSLNILETSTTNIHPHAVAQAPVASDTSRYPVLVFAPGIGLQASDYTTLAEDLASHGYVVAGIDPTYSTNVVLSGGRVVRAVPKAGDNADYNRLVAVWAQDMRFVTNQMRALDATSGGMFFSRLDIAKMGLFGHSAGGAAATLACRSTVWCGGAADLDGDLAGSVVQTGLGKPFLFLGDGRAFAREPYLKEMLRGVLRGVPADTGFVLTVAGAHHDSFTDRGLYFNVFALRGTVVGSINPTRALRIAGVYLRTFFRASLQGKTSALLEDSHSPYPEVRIVSVK
ncbi:MAG: hypothetical protein M3Z66_05270 [Chloroflexota bacterium]|nr:hypothetical protein [Chloroflexota bacterium]